MLKDIISKADYSFLRTDEKLGKNVILLGLCGSYSYGTNNENSDIDIRGCALNSKREILLGRDFEQITDISTDTVIFSFKKLVQLLTSCNPNVIELLGLKKEHYFEVTDIGRELLDNKELFLSQRAVKSFMGYAEHQFRKLKNACADEKLSMAEAESHIEAHRQKLSKLEMNFVRVYYMGFDLLEKGVVKTFRDEEHDLLMGLRNGKFLSAENKPAPEFFGLAEDLRNRFQYAAANTSLPHEPDIKRIEDFIISVNRRVVSSTED